MPKRGQITIFVILGILILAVVLGMLYLTKYLTKEKLKAEEKEALPLEVAPVKMFVENCLERTLKEGLVAVGKHGGYFILPEFSTTEAYINVPFYVYEGENKMPTLETIQKEISSYIEEQLLFCVQNFQAFTFPIEFENPEVRTDIGGEKVSTELFFPLRITEGEKIVRLELFSSSISSRLLQIYEVSSELTTFEFHRTFRS